MSPVLLGLGRRATGGSLDLRSAEAADVVDGEQSNWIVNARSPMFIPASSARFAALRFTGVAIPQGATITSAVLTLYSHHIQTWTTPAQDLTLGAYQVDNAPQATTATMAAIAGALGTTYVWASSANLVGGSPLSTGDFSPVVQEIVDRPNWSLGNALMLVLLHAGGGGTMQLKGHDSNAALRPRLELEFEP